MRGRIQIMSIGSDRVVVGFLSVGIRLGFRRNSSESDEIWVGFRWIPTKSGSDSDEIRLGSDRIYRSDWITWVAGYSFSPLVVYVLYFCIVKCVRIFIIEEECTADELFRLVRASVTTTLIAYFLDVHYLLLSVELICFSI
jgi:hypothetical protein